MIAETNENGETASNDFLRASGLVAQYDLVGTLVRYHLLEDSPSFRLCTEYITELHRRAYFGITSGAGEFRTVAVRVGEHAPPSADTVAAEINALCDHINSALCPESAVRSAAYVLWRLNWIHPFTDGNGTTARAASYLVLNAVLEVDLPGTPTIPEQIRMSRQEYYSALAHADVTQAEGSLDLGPLESMLSRMLHRQLSGIVDVPPDENDKINRIIELRVRRSPPKIRAGLFGGNDVTTRVWVEDDYIIVQVGTDSDIREAEERQRKTGEAFPRLIASADVAAHLVVRGTVPLLLKTQSFDASDGAVLMLKRDAAAIISQPTVTWQDSNSRGEWSVGGSLYVLRLGREVSLDDLSNSLEPLLVRHITEALRHVA